MHACSAILACSSHDITGKHALSSICGWKSSQVLLAAPLQRTMPYVHDATPNPSLSATTLVSLTQKQPVTRTFHVTACGSKQHPADRQIESNLSQLHDICERPVDNHQCAQTYSMYTSTESASTVCTKSNSFLLCTWAKRKKRFQAMTESVKTFMHLPSCKQHQLQKVLMTKTGTCVDCKTARCCEKQ